MVANRRLISRTDSRPQRGSSSRVTTPLCGRHFVDASQWGAMEGCAQTLSFHIHLLATTSRVDRSGHLGESLDTIGSEPRSTRACEQRGDFRRWHVCLGKKGGHKVGKTKRGKGTKIMVLTDAEGLPLAADTASASPHEVTLIEPLLVKRVLRRIPRHLIYDAAADSDPLRQRLKRRGIELICPHRRNRVKPPTQDGRRLRRYRRRWKIERSISWLQNFRRLVTRYEFYAHLFHGFVQLACLIVVLGRF